MSSQPPNRVTKWIHNAEAMLVRMATVARTTLGGYRWEGLLESTLEFLGLRTLTPTQAQALAARMHQELAGFVAACTEQRHALGVFERLFSRGNPMLVVTSLEKLRAMTDQLDGVLTEYTRVSQPVGATAQPVPGAAAAGAAAAGAAAGTPVPGAAAGAAAAGTPVPGAAAGAAAAGTPVPGAAGAAAAPSRLPNLSAADAAAFAKQLRAVYAHAIHMAQHAQASINGPQATNTYAVTSAVAAIHMLVRWLREHTEDLRTQVHL